MCYFWQRLFLSAGVAQLVTASYRSCALSDEPLEVLVASHTSPSSPSPGSRAMSMSREPSEEVGGMGYGPTAPVPVESASLTLAHASGLRCAWGNEE